MREAFDGERWGGAFELMAGNAGVALGALRLGDVDLAELAVTPYLSKGEPTEYGVTWENRHGQPGRSVYQKRQHIIEPVFGQTKDARGARRFMRRGKAAAQSEKVLMGTHNLLKLYRRTLTDPRSTTWAPRSTTWAPAGAAANH